jgi:hypothetical protein
MTFWCNVLENTLSSLISGAILVVLGLFFYKTLRKKETISEAIIDKELKIQFIVNEFKRMREKYTKPLSIDSHSSQVEQELTDLYGYCDEIKAHCKRFNLPFDSDLNLLMNHVYAKKGVLYCNNPVLIADEKIPLFENINKMEIDGIKFNRDSGKSVYFELFNRYEEEIIKLIEQKKFFKTYWKG